MSARLDGKRTRVTHDGCRIRFPNGSTADIGFGSPVVVRYFVGEADDGDEPEDGLSTALVREIYHVERKSGPRSKTDDDEDDRSDDEDPSSADEDEGAGIVLLVSWLPTLEEVRMYFPDYDPPGVVPPNERFYDLRTMDSAFPRTRVRGGCRVSHASSQFVKSIRAPRPRSPGRSSCTR